MIGISRSTRWGWEEFLAWVSPYRSIASNMAEGLRNGNSLRVLRKSQNCSKKKGRYLRGCQNKWNRTKLLISCRAFKMTLELFGRNFCSSGCSSCSSSGGISVLLFAEEARVVFCVCVFFCEIFELILFFHSVCEAIYWQGCWVLK